MVWQLWFFIFSLLFLAICVVYVLTTRNKTFISGVITEERADGSTVVLYKNAKIRIVPAKDNTPERWIIKGSKIPAFEPVDKSYQYPALGSKISTVFLLRDRDGFFHAQNIAYDEVQRIMVLRPNYRNVLKWMYQELEEKYKVREKQSKWKELLPYAVLMGSFVFVFLTFFFGWQYMEKRQTAIDGAIQDFDIRVQQARAMFDPVTLQRAAQIVGNYNLNTQTQNWTSNNVFLNNPATSAIGVTGS